MDSMGPGLRELSVPKLIIQPWRGDGVLSLCTQMVFMCVKYKLYFLTDGGVVADKEVASRDTKYSNVKLQTAPLLTWLNTMISSRQISILYSQKDNFSAANVFYQFQTNLS